MSVKEISLPGSQDETLVSALPPNLDEKKSKILVHLMSGSPAAQTMARTEANRFNLQNPDWFVTILFLYQTRTFGLFQAKS